MAVYIFEVFFKLASHYQIDYFKVFLHIYLMFFKLIYWLRLLMGISGEFTGLLLLPKQ